MMKLQCNSELCSTVHFFSAHTHTCIYTHTRVYTHTHTHRVQSVGVQTAGVSGCWLPAVRREHGGSRAADDIKHTLLWRDMLAHAAMHD